MWVFGIGLVLDSKLVCMYVMWDGNGRERNVLGSEDSPRTTRKPPNPMSSGSGLGSWVRTPISVVPCVPAVLRVMVSVQPLESGAEGQPALMITLRAMVS